MMAAKLVNSCLFKIKVIWNKGDDAILPGHTSSTKFLQVTQIMLQMWTYDQSLVTLWAILSGEFQFQFYNDLTRKTIFFKGWYWLKVNNLGVALVLALKFYNSLIKGLKLKVRKFLSNLLHFKMFDNVWLEKLVGKQWKTLPSSWIGLTLISAYMSSIQVHK